MAKEQRWIQAGALAGTAGFMLHCWVEFNWHVPANQLYFVMMLVLSGGVFSIASADDEKRRKTRRETYSHPTLKHDIS
jgi:hypothetical protein